MGLEDLQTIWEEQDEQNLFEINEEALYEKIQQASQSAYHKLNVYEWLMFFGNLIVGIVLLVVAIVENGQWYEYVLPALYVAYSISTIILRRARQIEEIRFEPTMIGDLDKAIWQINYLIKRGRSMMLWYMLPLMLVLSITLILNSKPYWALGTFLVVVPVSYFAGRWEINKWYQPKKLELEALRVQLLEGSN